MLWLSLEKGPSAVPLQEVLGHTQISHTPAPAPRTLLAQPILGVAVCCCSHLVSISIHLPCNHSRILLRKQGSLAQRPQTRSSFKRSWQAAASAQTGLLPSAHWAFLTKA